MPGVDELIEVVPANYPYRDLNGLVFNKDNTHPDYDEWEAAWGEARDCFDGAEAIKAKGETYLPQPGGMKDRPGAYEAYKLRAQVRELMALTVRGLSGVIHGKPSTYKTPGGLEDVIEHATRDGVPLEIFHTRITNEVLQVGRYGLLTDAPSAGGTPFLCGYLAEDIIDWSVGADGKLDLVVLDESGPGRDEDGDWINVNRWRRLVRFEGRYYAEVWEGSGDAAPSLKQFFQPMAKGNKALEEIPFVFIGTLDLTPKPDDVPLAQVAKSQLATYRLDADYRQSLYLTGQPTPVITGVDADGVPRYMGSAVAWVLPAGATAELLEYTGSSISAMRQAIRDEIDVAVMAGARMFEDNADTTTESGTSRALRYGNQTATVGSIAKTSAAGLQAAIGFIAMFTGADPDKAEVKPNLDFVETKLSGQDITSLVDSWMKGAISKQTLFENLQRGKVIPEGRTFDEEQELIAEEMPDEPEPAPGLLPSPDPNEPPLDPEAVAAAAAAAAAAGAV